MKVLLQRVKEARVKVAGELVGQIGTGFLLFVGFGQDDSEAKLLPMAQKLLSMRVFADEASKFNLSLQDVSGEVLVVSQFTLYADTAKGRRPDFTLALEPARARKLCDDFIEILRSLGVENVQSGVFGAHMEVSLVNDGPVTIMLER